MKITTASAPGKCILFGEHAVVYGVPAIACAINVRSRCNISYLETNHIKLKFLSYNQIHTFENLNALKKEIPEKFRQFGLLLHLLKERYKTPLKNIKISISSPLFPSAGLGSSASTIIAYIAALNDFYELSLEPQTISELAYLCEKHVHGKPSGIDNTICVFGNVIYYQEGRFERITIPYDLKILVTYTGREHNTKEAIEKVGRFKKEHENRFTQILKEINQIVEKGKQKLIEGDLEEIGVLMNQNQAFLTELGISDPAIDEINRLTLNNGAYGSKLTGAGQGGCVITLGPDDILDEISRKLKHKNYNCFLTEIDKKGVIIEG
ncbi:MAG: mevalonate kinase [Promethearchaeota archaeon]|nr:MAG: mevalonate kinase [Candidatus Lokiarchaeota archaeon]